MRARTHTRDHSTRLYGRCAQRRVALPAQILHAPVRQRHGRLEPVLLGSVRRSADVRYLCGDGARVAVSHTVHAVARYEERRQLVASERFETRLRERGERVSNSIHDAYDYTQHARCYIQNESPASHAELVASAGLGACTRARRWQRHCAPRRECVQHLLQHAQMSHKRTRAQHPTCNTAAHGLPPTTCASTDPSPVTPNSGAISKLHIA
jgi:hypothetical protein